MRDPSQKTVEVEVPMVRCKPLMFQPIFCCLEPVSAGCRNLIFLKLHTFPQLQVQNAFEVNSKVATCGCVYFVN